ncbi:MAG: FKBP-type peptidyl-prolyl cis-trans isomerase [Chlamydiae bacterium]|nr:FKBP-type peptidyl-prolyl cis-trans isomerase [Chlamydiota bacterium]
MNKAITCFSIAALMIFSSLYGEENTSSAKEQPEIGKISEAFGHLIGKNLESLGFEFDMQAVVQGLKDASAGKISPMTEVECIQAITTIQETAFKEQSQINLAKAEEFLKKNKKTKNVVSLEKGKVQYKIEKEGSGNSVKTNLSPVIRYVGKFLDGKVFGESKEDEHIALDEMIPGLQTGMAGMKEGEKRVIYIHPDMAYGTRGTLPPNSLLTFEIEVVKADAPLQIDDSMQQHENHDHEIAMPLTVEENLR